MAKDPKQQQAERLVTRQLRKSGLTAGPDSAAEQFVNRVRATYAEADEQRRLNDHAFKVASTEMAELNAQLATKNEELETALESLMRSEQIERLNAELSSKNEALSRLANTDSLTGLLNRYSFRHALEQVAESIQANQMLAVAIIDLDRFKLVNDTFGHNIGDQLLIGVAQNLQRLEGSSDYVARLGGDEFAFARVVDTDWQAEACAKDISEILHKPMIIDQQLIHGGGSVGLALSCNGDVDPIRLMRDADTAMYRAKENAAKTYQIFDLQFGKEVTRRCTLENEVRDAVANKEICLAYQPIVSAAENRTVVLEALSRWNSPTLGAVPPPEFIPAIERLGLSIEFGRQTLINACQQMRRWRDMCPDMGDVAVAVNFASPQLLDVGLVEFIATLAPVTQRWPIYLAFRPIF